MPYCTEFYSDFKSVKLRRFTSSEGKVLTWNVKGKKAGEESKAYLNTNNTGVTIEFARNDTPKFAWHFDSGHFSIEDLSQYQGSWKNKLFGQMLKEVELDKSKLAALYPFINGDIFTKKSPALISDYAVYALPLSGNQEKLAALKVLRPSPLSKPFARRLIRDLPANDRYAQSTVAESMIRLEFENTEISAYFKESDLKKKAAVLAAATMGNDDLVKDLYYAGFPLSVKGLDGLSPAGVAAANGHLNVFKFLAKAAPESLVREDGYDAPVHLATRNGHLDILKFLAEQAPKNFSLIGGRDSGTPAFLAVIERNIEALTLIAKHAPESLLVGDYSGCLPVHLAATKGNIEALKVIEKYVPENLSVPDNIANRTPAYLSVQFKHLDTLKFLAEHAPISLSVKAKNGKTAIDLAKENFPQEKVNEILEIAKKHLPKSDEPR